MQAAAAILALAYVSAYGTRTYLRSHNPLERLGLVLAAVLLTALIIALGIATTRTA